MKLIILYNSLVNNQPIYATDILKIVSIFIFAYVLLINHFLKDLDDIYFKLDECEYYLHLFRRSQQNLTKVCINLRMVGTKLHSVGFGVVGILTLIVCFLVWCMGVLIMSEDLNQFWYLVFPVLFITGYFWKKYVFYIHSLYNDRFIQLENQFRALLRNEENQIRFLILRLIPSYCNSDNFTEISDYHRIHLRYWKYFWIILLIIALIITTFFLIGIRFLIFYYFAYICLYISLFAYLVFFNRRLSIFSIIICVLALLCGLFGLIYFFTIIDYLQNNFSIFKSL
ncbi:MAG: hypothetical protein ACFFD2_16600 [Promethearchaeota archaeon]